MHRQLEEFAMERLDPADEAAVRAVAWTESFRPGDRLLRPGGRFGGLMIVESGFVKVCRDQRHHEVVLAVHGPGELLGEVALVDRGELTISVVAITGGHALCVDSASFWALLGARPHLNHVVLGTVTHRLRDADRHRTEQLTTSSAQRVAARIVGLAERFAVTVGDEVLIRVPLSQAEISSWAGVSRETGVRGLRRLREMGLIRLEHRRVVITDLGGLTQFADGI